MYVAVKGGEKAIDNAHRLLAAERRGDPSVPELTVAQIAGQLGRAVDRVMTEASLYDPEIAALAIKQAQGDLVEAIFLVRAFRTTLPRLAASQPVETDRIAARRRISATFKDLPGGQLLGPTYDYTHRLLDFSLTEPAAAPPPVAGPTTGEVTTGEATLNEAAMSKAAGDDDAAASAMARVTVLLDGEGLIERERSPGDDGAAPADLTRTPLRLPAERELRLQNLARGDEGFLLALAYSTQRGFGHSHPFAGEIRMGEVTVEVVPEDLGFAVPIGEITVTECEMINQFQGGAGQPPRFTRGYGLAFGQAERKAMAMALVDRALRARELDEPVTAPAQDEEFVLMHSDNVEASGFVQHLKLPHYVDFQSELELIRRLRAAAGEACADDESRAGGVAEGEP